MNDIQRLRRGRSIYDQITPYPLPYEPGKYRNYVVFFVSRKDPYGAHARHFFKTYYKNHQKIDATSLEDMFEKIDRNLRKVPAGIKIQELVIVAHGNFWGHLGVPLTKGSYGSGLNASVIATLQQEIDEPKNRNFKLQREKVIARLDEQSWIAVRACNFGYSSEGMFALYSLFGGRANLYGIRAYMTFVTYDQEKGNRFKDIYELYDLLRKQGFLSREPVENPKLQIKVLREIATIADKKFTSTSIQSFITSFYANEEFDGLISELITQPPREHLLKGPSLEEVVLQLNANNSKGITALLEQRKETFDIAGNIRIARMRKKNTWAVSWQNSKGKSKKFLIKLKYPAFYMNFSKILSIYAIVTPEEISSAEWARYLTNYDQPGCELHAQLDLYSIDDLICLQTYIRANYKPKEAVLIEQAQRSIGRRKNEFSFYRKTECFKDMYEKNNPLPDSDIESCTWFSSGLLGVGLAENERDDLKARAHTDHYGKNIWVDVKVGQRKREFKDDLFLEGKLPYAKEPVVKELDIVDISGDKTEKKERKRKKKDYEFKFDKDSPSIDLSEEEEINPKDILQNLSDNELRELLEKALEQIEDDVVSDDSDDREIGIAIDKTTLAISTILTTATEISAWLPASAFAKITASAGFFAIEVLNAVISPVLGWVALTIEFRYATERHRGWGMRTALQLCSHNLRELSYNFINGPVPNRPIKNWTDSSVVAVIKELKKSGSNLPIYWKFHKGYDFVVEKITTLPNDLLNEAEKVVHKKFADLGLSKAKIEIVMESGLVDINKVYGKTLLGLADLLIKVLRKMEKD